MKTTSLKNLLKLSLVHLAFAGIAITANAQSRYNASNVDLKLTGTSTLHDWEMKGSRGSSEATFVLGANDKLTSIAGLSFSIPARNLKSDKTMMDNNTYKALKADANPNISFVLTSANVTPVNGNEYQIVAKGKLTIAGTTRETDLFATGRLNPADKSITVHGSKKMKMTDYQVKPPVLMLGTLKTGDDITITYNLRFVK